MPRHGRLGQELRAHPEEQAAAAAAEWAEHDAVWKEAEDRKAKEQQAKADEDRRMSTAAFDATSAVAANANAATGTVVAQGTLLGTNGAVLSAEGTLLGTMQPDGMMVGPDGAVLGWRKPDGTVRQHPDHLELVPASGTGGADKVADIFREMQVRSRWTPDQMAKLFREMDTDGDGPSARWKVPSQ